MSDRARRILRALVPYALVAVIGGGTALALADRIGALGGFDELVWAKPWALLLLFACALLAWVGFHLHARRAASLSFSQVGELARARRGVAAWLLPLPRALRVVAVGLIAFALARPQTMTREEIEVEGVDIMLVLDLSRSMEEQDMPRNRLDAAQRTIRRFLEGRKHDRIGLVVFAKEAMLQCPLTLDYRALDTIVSNLAIGDLDPMGTAIGDGLGLALASLRRSTAKSKVVILLTDGDSNVVNEMNPEEATRVARERGVRVFTVLMGREAGPLISPRLRQYGTNPELLRRIAAETRGRYFHAGDADALARSFEEVRATLEKTKMRQVGKVYGELYPMFVAPALGFLLVEILLGLTRFRRFP